MKIGIIGGTGKEGRALGTRWAKAGHAVTLGSRDAARAEATARELAESGAVGLTAGDNVFAAREGEVVVLCVPYGAHGETLRGLAAVLTGKVLIDITVPLVPPAVRTVSLPAGEAAALEAQAIVGSGTPVVAALHHVSAIHLGDPDHPLDCDALFCTDDPRARAIAATLLADLGLRAVDAGALRNAIALEALTPVLLHINKTHKTSAGIRITGI